MPLGPSISRGLSSNKPPSIYLLTSKGIVDCEWSLFSSAHARPRHSNKGEAGLLLLPNRSCSHRIFIPRYMRPCAVLSAFVFAVSHDAWLHVVLLAVRREHLKTRLVEAAFPIMFRVTNKSVELTA